MEMVGPRITYVYLSHGQEMAAHATRMMKLIRRPLDQAHLSLATETLSSTSATRCFRRIASGNENMGIIAQFNQHVKRPEKRRCLARIAGYTRCSVAMRLGAEKDSMAKVAELDPDA